MGQRAAPRGGERLCLSRPHSRTIPLDPGDVVCVARRIETAVWRGPGDSVLAPLRDEAWRRREAYLSDGGEPRRRALPLRHRTRPGDVPVGEPTLSRGAQPIRATPAVGQAAGEVLQQTG